MRGTGNVAGRALSADGPRTTKLALISSGFTLSKHDFAVIFRLNYGLHKFYRLRINVMRRSLPNVLLKTTEEKALYLYS